MSIITPLPSPAIVNNTKIQMPYSGFFRLNVDVPDNILDETSVLESHQTESLLSPSLETTVRIQSTIDNPIVKNYDLFREKQLSLFTYNPNIDGGKVFTSNQVIYRMASRNKIHGTNVEEFVLHACDPTLIENHKTRISDHYSCKTPTQVAEIALTAIGAQVNTEASSPAKDYMATNLHPFQVLSEQADTALAEGTDPSFLHFMTFQDGGTGIHNFRSLRSMTKQPSMWTYNYSDKGFGIQLGDPHGIMLYEFPCDFDLLTDILNGIGPDGSNLTSVTTYNPFNGVISLVNGKIGQAGGMGTSINNPVTSDVNSPDGCVTSVEQYQSLRQARLCLIRPEDTALKLVVPYNGYLHAGNIITANFPSRITQDLNYGSGDYIIVSLTHNIKAGGYGTTTLDLATQSIGEGIV